MTVEGDGEVAVALPVRARVLEAAVELLGTQGLSALTHRRVDRAAGVPVGSCSNYFRTRDALLVGAAAAVLDRELAGLGATARPRSGEDLLDLLVQLVDRTTGAQRTLSTARLVLFVEGSHHPSLREELSRGRGAMQAWLTDVLEGLGADDPGTTALTLMACAEGVILHRIARHDHADVRPLLAPVVRSGFAPGRRRRGEAR